MQKNCPLSSFDHLPISWGKKLSVCCLYSAYILFLVPLSLAVRPQKQKQFIYSSFLLICLSLSCFECLSLLLVLC